MEPRLRGILEQILDDSLSDRALRLEFTSFERYRENGIIESTKSAMFGSIFSRLLDM